MIETILFKGEVYPKFQSEGNAAQFILPFAKQVCKGDGLDIGFGELEWKFPGALGIDSKTPDEWHAHNVPTNIKREENGYKWDFIFSSHLLEHIPDWVGTLDYWTSYLANGGVLFLYLPHPEQLYWRPYHNRKHLSMLHPKDIEGYLIHRGFKNIFVSGRDLNHSFAAMAEK